MSVDLAPGRTMGAGAVRRASFVANPATPNVSRAPWYLFSPRVDLVAFLGSGVLSIAALGIGWKLGLLQKDTPEWAWIFGILMVDVAHVYATVFRVYADSEEMRRAPVLYTVTPILGYVGGAALLGLAGERWFWRVLAYIAVFHFVRQQYGWVMLYRARRGESGRWGRRIDAAVIYLAMLYPLLYWHAHLPRRFWWFQPQDFTPFPFDLMVLVKVCFVAYVGVLAAYVGHALYTWRHLGITNPGKHIVVVTTAVCWYVGIITFDSDYAFTMTNVLIHGIPYLALVFWYGRDRARELPHPGIYKIFNWSPIYFLALLWLAGFVEEMIWHRAVWQTRPELFGAAWNFGDTALLFLVPLLALPQLVHYLLDGFLWRRRSAPFIRRLVGGPPIPDPRSPIPGPYI